MKPPQGHRSDGEIIDDILGGNADAFEIILERYGDRILRILKRHLPVDQIEDVAQEVFIQAYKSLNACRQPERFKAWISAIAVRTCYDFWRKRYRSREMTLSALTPEQENWLMRTMADDSVETHEMLGKQQEAKEILDYALARLSPEDRMVVSLVYLEELSVKEAARLLGWSVANVKVRSFRTRKKLHRLLTKQHKELP